MTWVQHEEAALGANFEVKGEDEAEQSNPETHLFNQIQLQLSNWGFFLAQMTTPAPNNEQSNSSSSETDSP